MLVPLCSKARHLTVSSNFQAVRTLVHYCERSARASSLLCSSLPTMSPGGISRHTRLSVQVQTSMAGCLASKKLNLCPAHCIAWTWTFIFEQFNGPFGPFPTTNPAVLSKDHLVYYRGHEIPTRCEQRIQPSTRGRGGEGNCLTCTTSSSG